MKTYLAIINQGENYDNAKVLDYLNYLDDNKFEWWKYSFDTMCLATPDSVTAEELEQKIIELFPHAISAVIETDFKGWSGYGPKRVYDGENVSFMHWFNKIKEKDFVPAWEENPKRVYQKASGNLFLSDISQTPDNTIGVTGEH